MGRTSPQKHNSEMEPPTATTRDSKFDFIVYKGVCDEPLYNEQERRHRISSRLQDEVLFDSVLAFGGMRRVSRNSSKSKARKSSASTSTSRSLSPSHNHSSKSSPSIYSDQSRRSSTSLSSLSSASSTSSNRQSTYSDRSRTSSRTSEVPTPAYASSSDDDMASTEAERLLAWKAFRAKYERRSDNDRVAPSGRYGIGRGYIEYRHRKSCNGDCGGACFGK